MSTKPVALVFGGSGETGQSVVNGLLDKGDFTVRIAVRPGSNQKPRIVDFQRRGVEVAAIDLIEDSDAKLEEALQGIHTVICALAYDRNNLQPRLVDAAIKAGVKRFVPSDFGTPGRKGVRLLHDDKLAVREYVQNSGIPYTFIDVGFWYQFKFVNVVPEQAMVPYVYECSRTIYGDGETKAAFIHRDDIGRFVARIVADERTLNRYVFAYGGEATLHELFALAERITGRKIERRYKTGEELLQYIKDERAQGRHSPYHEYLYSMWILGEDRKERAVLPELGGALIGAELYPDFKPRSIEDYAQEIYEPYKL